MKITRDPYIDANKVIEVGDCYFLSIKYWDEDKINNRFKTSGIPVIESDLYNPNRVSYSCGGIMNFEPIFLLDDPSLKDEIILTFDCFTYNSYPQTGITIHSEDSKKIKVNQHSFSNAGYCYSSIEIIGDDKSLIDYYAISVTVDNIEEVKKSFSYESSSILFDSSGKLFNLYEEASKINSRMTQYLKISVFCHISVGLIFFVVFFSYMEKNKKDIHILRILGYSKVYTSFLILSIPIAALFISFGLSLPLDYLFVFISNLIIGKGEPSIGVNISFTFKLQIVTIASIIFFTMLGNMIFMFKTKLTGGKIND